MMFTVDVEGDWDSHGIRALREVLPSFLELLERYSVKATFFVVANLVPYIRDLVAPDGPHEVASHGLTHSVLTRLSSEELEFELAESKRVLEAEEYRVAGFRAPYFESPPGLPSLLARSGYEYDASSGSVYPGFRSRKKVPSHWNTQPRIACVQASTLRDGLTPFSLTYLRLYHPFGLRLISPNATLFYCHLHEFLEESEGWQRLPRSLRRLHRRNSGAAAWNIVEQLLRRFGPRFLTCEEYVHYM